MYASELSGDSGCDFGPDFSFERRGVEGGTPWIEAGRRIDVGTKASRAPDSGVGDPCIGDPGTASDF